MREKKQVKKAVLVTGAVVCAAVLGGGVCLTMEGKGGGMFFSSAYGKNSVFLASADKESSASSTGERGEFFASSNMGSSGAQVTMEELFTQEEYEMLAALRFDGYEDLSVRDYQLKAWEKTDTPEYRELLDKVGQSETCYEKKDSDALANYLFYVLEPLTAERWQKRDFSGCVQKHCGDGTQAAMLEYDYTLTITDADVLTVRAYKETQDAIRRDLEQLLSEAEDQALSDGAAMQAFFDEELARREEQWSTGGLEVDLEYCVQPIDAGDCGEAENGPSTDDARDNTDEYEEARQYPNGTEADYRSLLALKTPGYENLSVEEFNRRVIAWADEDYERMERIGEDTARNDFQVTLSEEELLFVTRTVLLSGKENAKEVASSYTGRAAEDPFYQENLPEKKSGSGASWCDLYYTFTYHIADKSRLTVGERDRMVGAMIDGVREFWANKNLAELLQMDRAKVAARIRAIAEKSSDALLTISVGADDVAFEQYDERGAYDRLVSYRMADYEKMSVAAFNAALSDTEEELARLMDANAEVSDTLSCEDENYDFIMNTMSVSLSELYCDIFDEPYGVFASAIKQARPYAYGWDDGEPIYAFQCNAGLWVGYTVGQPKQLTIGERGRRLQAMKDGLQRYVDGLSEEEIAGGDFKEKLEKEGARLAKKLSDKRMRLSCEVQSVEIWRDGEEIM